MHRCHKCDKKFETKGAKLIHFQRKKCPEIETDGEAGAAHFVDLMEELAEDLSEK